jgi:hypothetical protein
LLGREAEALCIRAIDEAEARLRIAVADEYGRRVGDQGQLICVVAQLLFRLLTADGKGQLTCNRKPEFALFLVEAMRRVPVRHELADQPPLEHQRNEGETCNAFIGDGVA